jgi:hypothetical protein
MIRASRRNPPSAEPLKPAISPWVLLILFVSVATICWFLYATVAAIIFTIFATLIAAALSIYRNAFQEINACTKL